MRTIPVEKTIAGEPRRVKFEEISYWMDKAGDSIGVAPCECRKLRRMLGEGTADLEFDCCINLGKYAESCIRVGKARRITREEAEKIILEAERRGAVHQLSNIDGPDQKDRDPGQQGLLRPRALAAGFPHKPQERDPRDRYRPLQDQLSRPYRGAGLTEESGGGQVPGGPGAH